MKRGLTMLAPERRKLSYLVRKFVLANGGSEVRDYVDHVSYKLPTVAGELGVIYDRGWGTIFGRFGDVEAAKKLLGTAPYNRLNPYSGKWNFHFGRITAEAAFEQWTGALARNGLLDDAAKRLKEAPEPFTVRTGRWSGTEYNRSNTPKVAAPEPSAAVKLGAKIHEEIERRMKGK